MKRVGLVIAFVLLVLVALGVVVALRTARLGTVAAPRHEPAAALAYDLDAAVGRLVGALRIPTVSEGSEPPDSAAVAALHGYLEASFPRVHATLVRERIGGGGLLYTWPGSDPDLPPLALLAHLDVVPAPDPDRWTHPPFAGAVDDGYVWGRGAIDDKDAALALLEAIEALLGEGFAPRRTVLLGFGHDEEVGGARGGLAMAELVAARGIRPFLVLDEGGLIADGIVPGVEGPVALVGITEKGYRSLELVARGPGGHSSLPPAETPVVLLARALERLAARPMPARLEGPFMDQLEALAPVMGPVERIAIANRWLLGPLLERRLAARPATNAMLRTTTAPTMLEAGVKENVLPTEARAVVNFRVHPNDSIEAVVAHVVDAIGDPRIEVRPYGSIVSEPRPPSPVVGPAYRLVERTIRQVVPAARVVPTVVVGGTDARHWAGRAEAILNFEPITLRSGDLVRIHGFDERIPIADVDRLVRFYAQLVRNAQEPAAE